MDQSYNSGHTQKPSSARLTQLNANMEQTIAAADAKRAIAFADRMTRILVANGQILSNDLCPMMARIRRDR
jgi:hypothetical protein